MLLFLAILFFVLWALGFLAFHMTVAAIHLLLFIAIVLLIAYFVRGRATV